MEGPMYPPEYMIDDDYQLAEHFLLKGLVLYMQPAPHPDYIREQAGIAIEYLKDRCEYAETTLAALRQQLADAQDEVQRLRDALDAIRNYPGNDYAEMSRDELCDELQTVKHIARAALESEAHS